MRHASLDSRMNLSPVFQIPPGAPDKWKAVGCEFMWSPHQQRSTRPPCWRRGARGTARLAASAKSSPEASGQWSCPGASSLCLVTLALCVIAFSFVLFLKVIQWQQHRQDTLHSCLSWTMSKPTAGDRLPSYRPTTLKLDLRQCNHPIETSIYKMVVVVVPGTNGKTRLFLTAGSPMHPK